MANTSLKLCNIAIKRRIETPVISLVFEHILGRRQHMRHSAANSGDGVFAPIYRFIIVLAWPDRQGAVTKRKKRNQVSTSL